MMRKITGLCLIAVTIAAGGAAAGCGGGAVPQPVAPAAESPRPAPGPGGSEKPGAPADPFALPPRPAEAELFALADADAKPVDVTVLQKAAKTKGIAPRPKACAAYETRAASKAGGDPLASAEPGERDARLVALEGQHPAAIPALRADLAPLECADAITDKKIPATGSVTGKHASVLVGLSLASKLSRTALAPPTMEDSNDKEKVKAFIKGPLAKWVVEQASAIEALSAAAAGLRGYGRGIAAVAAGVADLRLVDRIRSAPTPKGWDRELKAVYEAALDEALEPRKNRGRDAALVGLSELAQVGVLRDERVKSARALLAKLYGGRRIDALDALLLPEWKAPASPVPAYWEVAAPELGLHAEGVRLRPKCAGAACVDVARGRFEMGRTYWRRADFVEAAYAAKEAGADPHARLLLALSVTLAKGPNGAKEMMAAASPAALGLDHVEALDAVAAEGGPTAGMAAFDAAHLRALSVPEGDAAPAYLREVASRFKKSAPLLADSNDKKLAEQRADDADSAALAAEKKK